MIMRRIMAKRGKSGGGTGDSSGRAAAEGEVAGAAARRDGGDDACAAAAAARTVLSNATTGHGAGGNGASAPATPPGADEPHVRRGVAVLSDAGLTAVPARGDRPRLLVVARVAGAVRRAAQYARPGSVATPTPQSARMRRQRNKGARHRRSTPTQQPSRRPVTSGVVVAAVVRHGCAARGRPGGPAAAVAGSNARRARCPAAAGVATPPASRGARRRPDWPRRPRRRRRSPRRSRRRRGAPPPQQQPSPAAVTRPPSAAGDAGRPPGRPCRSASAGHALRRRSRRSRRCCSRSPGKSAGSSAGSTPCCAPRPPRMLERWGDRYCLIGPYNPADRRRRVRGAADLRLHPRHARSGSATRASPATSAAGSSPGRPRVILLDYRARYRQLGARQVPDVEGPRHLRRPTTTAR